MTITLGSVTLNDHVSCRGRWNAPKSAGSERMTLTGKVIIQRTNISFDDPDSFSLEAIEEDNIRKGYFLQSQLEALADYRDQGTVIEFNFHSDITCSVMIPIDGIQVEKNFDKI